MVLILAEDVGDQLEGGQLELWDGLDKEGGHPDGGDVEDSGVGQQGQFDQVAEEVGQLPALGVEADDVLVADVTPVRPLLLHRTDVAVFALGDLLVHGVVRRVDRVGQLEAEKHRHPENR